MKRPARLPVAPEPEPSMPKGWQLELYRAVVDESHRGSGAAFHTHELAPDDPEWEEKRREWFAQVHEAEVEKKRRKRASR